MSLLDEAEAGDRWSLCELLHSIGRLAEQEWLRDQWTNDSYVSSFRELLSTAFNDLRLRDRATMLDGYLGTYSGMPANLKALADELDLFDKRREATPSKSDLEILNDPEWQRISLAAGTIVDRSSSWIADNCEASR